jgi:hypothetical protein
MLMGLPISAISRASLNGEEPGADFETLEACCSCRPFSAAADFSEKEQVQKLSDLQISHIMPVNTK